MDSNSIPSAPFTVTVETGGTDLFGRDRWETREAVDCETLVEAQAIRVGLIEKWVARPLRVVIHNNHEGGSYGLREV